MKIRNYVFLSTVLFSTGLFVFSTVRVGYSQSPPWTAPAYVDTIKNPIAFNQSEKNEAIKLYNSTCWACHGLDGKGNGPAAVNMKIKPADHTSRKVQGESDGSLFWKIYMGRGDMQPYLKVLSVKQRWALVHYIRSLAQKK
ncbi:MAG: cytochrome c [Bacteroidetes bacterium]|nr:cytochrome c [Bacteroidota bacterium]